MSPKKLTFKFFKNMKKAEGGKRSLRRVSSLKLCNKIKQHPRNAEGDKRRGVLLVPSKALALLTPKAVNEV